MYPAAYAEKAAAVKRDIQALQASVSEDFKAERKNGIAIMEDTKLGNSISFVNENNRPLTKSQVDQLREERACYAQIVRDNTDYDILVEQFPEQAAEINELMSVMVDVICSRKKAIRVNGEEFPREIVKSQLLKLNSSHIEYVLTALKKNTSNVRNIRSYMITALYNAPVTMSSFYRAEVNHDMF